MPFWAQCVGYALALLMAAGGYYLVVVKAGMPGWIIATFPQVWADVRRSPKNIAIAAAFLCGGLVLAFGFLYLILFTNPKLF